MPSPPPSKQFAVVTLLSSPSYIPGALTLASSLRLLHQKPCRSDDLSLDAFDIVCLATPNLLSSDHFDVVHRLFDSVVSIEPIEPNPISLAHIAGRPQLGSALAKLHAFRLTQYQRILYMDADTLPLKPISHLFSLAHDFAAVPDIGWPDIFNSGVMLFKPSDASFQELIQLHQSQGSWDGADQGLLNEWRGSNWHRLSFVYNTTPSGAYIYAPAYKKFGSDIKVLHFIGPSKPWAVATRPPSPPSEIIKGTTIHESSDFDHVDLVKAWKNAYNNVEPRPEEFEETAEIKTDDSTRMSVPESEMASMTSSSSSSSPEIKAGHVTMPRKLVYSNAWDDVPTIIRYSAKLRTRYRAAI